MTSCNKGKFSELNTVSPQIFSKSKFQKRNTMNVLAHFTFLFLIIYRIMNSCLIFVGLSCFQIYIVSVDFGVKIFQYQKIFTPKSRLTLHI